MADQKYCRNCGEPNLPNAAYCANCGATVAAAAPPRRSRTFFGLSRKMIVVGLVVVVLLLTLGCVALMANTPSTMTTTNPTATPTATTPQQATTTPTATPSTATFDPVLKKLESELNAEYPNATFIKEAPAASTGESVDLLRIDLTLPNGDIVMGTATNDTVAAQTQDYQISIQPTSRTVLDATHTTHFGQSAAEAALGGPSTSFVAQDTSLRFTDAASTYNEFLLYYNTGASNAILFSINVGPNPLT